MQIQQLRLGSTSEYCTGFVHRHPKTQSSCEIKHGNDETNAEDQRLVECDKTDHSVQAQRSPDSISCDFYISDSFQL